MTPIKPDMVLTFTGMLGVVDSGRDEVRDMLVSAIGCNLAWGFVDRVMYALRNIVQRGRKAKVWRAGLVMVLLGVALEAVIVALGG